MHAGEPVTAGRSSHPVDGCGEDSADRQDGTHPGTEARSTAAGDAHGKEVGDHYDRLTESFYLNWSRDHIHLGVFEPGECPEPGEMNWQSKGLARALIRTVELTVAPAGIEAHHRVVDAGCGVGGTAILLAKQVGCSVTGVSNSAVHLKLAEEKAVAEGVSELVRFEYADCSRRLPFPDDSIDVVVNVESACHYHDRYQFLREVRRVLKPGGRLAAMDWMAPDGLTSEQHDEFLQPMLSAYVIKSLDSPSSYSEKLRRAGLEILEFEGFGGKEMDNLKLIKNSRDNFCFSLLAGAKSPEFLALFERMRTFYLAWSNGAFETRRYCAVKPG
ncbi:MAG: methyltransferase domain-containing protein [Boseongicola sp. SB0677_bin_26]|nr:methyltransferase domain-containing protein [Boseongicola sp. SB0665_bin_10]MYG26065.1 methyltransferase domain-containing protein [Boseongicola sp. SB0677_bin_26]